MKRKLRITLGVILFSLSLFGCAHNPQKEKKNISGLVPYIFTFDKKYFPKADYTKPKDPAEENLLRYNF